MLTRTDIALNVNRFGQRLLRTWTDISSDEKSGDTHNKGLAKVAVQWLIEYLCFVSSVVLADSFVLRIRHLRQAPNVMRHAWGHC